MNRLRSSLLTVTATGLFFLAAHAAAQGPPAAQRPPAAQKPATTDPNRARELFKKGVKAYDQGNVREAYENYRAAWELLHSYDIAGNLANVERELGKHRDAAEHAAYALANFPPVGTDKQRRFLEELLAEAKKHVGALYIRVDVDRAAVTVDGKSVGESPLSTPVFVDPGDHVIAVSSADHEPSQQTVHADAGSAPVVTITLAPKRVGPAPTALPTAPTADPGAPSIFASPVVISGGVATLLAVGLGATFTALANGKAGDAQQTFDALRKQNDPGLCARPGAPSTCGDLVDLRRSRDTFSNVALWSFVGAGVLAAGTFVYILAAPRPQASPAPKTSLRAAPIVAPSFGGAMLEGAF